MTFSIKMRRWPDLTDEFVQFQHGVLARADDEEDDIPNLKPMKLLNPDEPSDDMSHPFFYQDALLGDFYWNLTTLAELAAEVPLQRTLVIMLPTAQGHCLTHWPTTHANPNGDQWSWDGNEDEPTLTPVLHLTGGWHGWVQGGTLVAD